MCRGISLGNDRSETQEDVHGHLLTRSPLSKLGTQAMKSFMLDLRSKPAVKTCGQSFYGSVEVTMGSHVLILDCAVDMILCDIDYLCSPLQCSC
jgi:hypothetical protein